MTSLSMPAGLSLIFPKCDQHVGPIHHHMIACAGIFREQYTEVLFDKLEEFWNRPSKYIRSLTLTYIVEQLGGDVSKAYACGAALEIYHAASLIFDDIQDGSEIRRQGKTVHVSDGLSLAMSLGAILRSLMYHPINQCQELTTDEKCFVHECIDKTCTKVACGQALEMMWRKYPEMDIERDAYIDMISKKTGSLIAAAFTIGAYLSNTNPETAAQLGKFGEEFGVLFQLHNDLLDLSGGEMIGRPAYDDLRCAKRTYIVLSCLARLEEMKAEEDLEKFLGLLRQRRLDEEQIDWCVEQLNRTEQIEAARVDLVNRLEALRSSVDRIDVPLPLRETLSKLLMFFIKVPSSPAKS